jgi:hypothetical protein
MRIPLSAAAAASLAGGIFFGWAIGPAVAAHPDVTIKMHAQNGSGEYGTATLTDLGGRTRVVIALQHENTLGNQPAHVHLGPCAKLNKAPKYPLKNVILGHSNTTVDVPINEILGHGMAINVHESASQLGRYVSCGNIP